MRKSRIARVLTLLPFGVVAVLVFGFLIMSLWNWLMPALFGLKQIGFWQALGLFILSKILFGGFGGGAPHRGRHFRRRMLRRWAQMTPEERQKFREELRRDCGHVEPPSPKPAP